MDKAVGKRKSKSSNKDVLDLAKGNNRKLIRYLLRKRNVDNSRMFEIKDIISIIKEANKKIEADKIANPQYRANKAGYAEVSLFLSWLDDMKKFSDCLMIIMQIQ